MAYFWGRSKVENQFDVLQHFFHPVFCCDLVFKADLQTDQPKLIRMVIKSEVHVLS